MDPFRFDDLPNSADFIRDSLKQCTEKKHSGYYITGYKRLHFPTTVGKQLIMTLGVIKLK